MRGQASLLAAAALLVAASGAAADPSDVYVDFASDGKLDCTHSQGDLEGILTDASLNEYGDPLTLTRLRLAVRRGLAAGCVGGGAPSPAGTPGAAEPAGQVAPGTSGATGERAGAQEATASTGATDNEPPTPITTAVPNGSTAATTAPATQAEPTIDTVAVPAARGDGGDGGDGGTPLVGVAAALGVGALALGVGGWLARRTLTRSP